MFNWLKNKIQKRSMNSASSFADLWNRDLIGGDNNRSSLSIATAYACIKVKADKLSSTKLKFYNETDKGNIELKTHRLTKLLKKPSKNITYNRWINYMVSNLDLYGNSYALIIRDENGYPIEMIPLKNTDVSIMKTFENDILYYYQITLNNNTLLKIEQEDIIHFKNISLDGIIGINPLEYHKLTFDSAKRQNEYHKAFLDNSAAPSGVIETEKKLSKEAAEELRNNFSKKYSGTDNSGKTPVLPEGLKYKQLNIVSPLDTDYINTKKLTEEEIARIYGVPLSMLGDNGSTYANAEQDTIKFNEITLQPIEDMIVEELGIKLINFYITSNNYFEFAHESINLSSAKDKAELISQLKREGIITPNEAREYYNKPAVENGDNLIIQINTAPQNLVEEQMEANIKNTTKTTEKLNQEPKPDIKKEEPVIEDKKVDTNNNQSEEIKQLKRSIQQMKSEIGRLKK